MSIIRCRYGFQAPETNRTSSHSTCRIRKGPSGHIFAGCAALAARRNLVGPRIAARHIGEYEAAALGQVRLYGPGLGREAHRRPMRLDQFGSIKSRRSAKTFTSFPRG